MSVGLISLWAQTSAVTYSYLLLSGMVLVPSPGWVPSSQGFSGLSHMCGTSMASVSYWAQMSSASGCPLSPWGWGRGEREKLSFLLERHLDTRCQSSVFWCPVCYTAEYSSLLSVGTRPEPGPRVGGAVLFSVNSRSRNS